MKIAFTLNGKAQSWQCEAGMSLRDLLKSKGYITVRNGCDGEGSCGLCSIIFNGRTVNSCQLLAAQAAGSEIFTVDYFSKNRQLSTIQDALVKCGCVQCGYCTPAVVLCFVKMFERSPDPSEAEIRDALSGILCRCTGYEQFYNAAHLAAKLFKDPDYKYTPAKEYRAELRHVGKCREKIDAPALARGEAAYVEDRVPPDACVLKLLSSPYARAYITDIDTSAARAMPGVAAVACYKDAPDISYTTAGQGYPEPSPYDSRLFSRMLRFVGDRVAAVIADSEGNALAALAKIKVEYKVLPPVLSIDEAAAPSAPRVRAGEQHYVAGGPADGVSTAGDSSVYGGPDDDIIYQFPIGADPAHNIAASAGDEIGDVDKALAAADFTVDEEYSMPRVQCTPLEPHVVYTRMEGGRLVIHASTQVPWHLRRITAKVIGVPENKIRVIKERVGGGFGAKQDIVLEDLAAWFTWKTGRPVFYRYTREEEFVESRIRHQMKIRVRLGAKKDGSLTAIDFMVRADTGPYGQHCLTVPMNACSKTLPLLDCKNIRFSVKTYYTNLPTTGAYQGYGAPQGSFALQSALAELAARMGMDQVEFLEKNRVREGSKLEILKSLGEGRAGAVVTVGKCGLGEMLERGRKSIEWGRKEKSADPDWVIGKGAVIIQQGSGLPGLDAANAEIRLLGDGTFMLLSGGADLGTGLDTLTVKICAETLCVDPKDISVLSGDTDMTPFDKGAYASSGTFFSGSAARLAAEDLRAKILAAAAAFLGEAAEDLKLEPVGIIRGKKGRTSYAEIGHLTTTGEGPGELSGKGSFKSDHAAFPYGAHFAEVAVNRRTGEVALRRYHAYMDCGTPINPELAEGQVFGGVLKAIGHSLYEEMIFDDKGRCLNPNFLDYKIPGIREVPPDYRVEFVPVDDPVGPFGGKSVSEISLNGAAPVIASAIHDATGAWVREWPFTPERVLRAMGKL